MIDDDNGDGNEYVVKIAKETLGAFDRPHTLGGYALYDRYPKIAADLLGRPVVIGGVAHAEVASFEPSERDLPAVREAFQSLSETRKIKLVNALEDEPLPGIVKGTDGLPANQTSPQAFADWLTSRTDGPTDEQLFNVLEWHDHLAKARKMNPEMLEAVDSTRQAYMQDLEQRVIDGAAPPKLLENARIAMRRTIILPTDPFDECLLRGDGTGAYTAYNDEGTPIIVLPKGFPPHNLRHEITHTIGSLNVEEAIEAVGTEKAAQIELERILDEAFTEEITEIIEGTSLAERQVRFTYVGEQALLSDIKELSNMDDMASAEFFAANLRLPDLQRLVRDRSGYDLIGYLLDFVKVAQVRTNETELMPDVHVAILVKQLATIKKLIRARQTDALAYGQIRAEFLAADVDPEAPKHDQDYLCCQGILITGTTARGLLTSWSRVRGFRYRESLLSVV